MRDLLHIKRQCDGLPTSGFHESRFHLIVMGERDAFSLKGLRTVEVIAAAGVCQQDTWSSAVDHHIRDGPAHILGILHIEQQVRVIDNGTERSSRIPDDSRQLVTRLQGILLNTIHLPCLLPIGHGSWYLQCLPIVARCHIHLLVCL